MLGLLTIAGVLMAYTMVANRLSQGILTAPLIFLAFGFAMSALGLMPGDGAEEALHIVAEVALIVLLFLDAAQIDQKALLHRSVWPARMLFIGLPLAFVIGTGLSSALFPEWPLALAALAAALLVPTDAALGQPVVSNPSVPERPKRALIVESGLNDGLALPLILLLAAIAAPSGDAPSEGWTLFALKQVTLGPLVGIIMGIVAGKILLWAKRTQSTSDTFEGIGALALAGGAYIGAGMVGGNGFIAAFAAGLGFGAIVRGKCAFVFEFTEGEGQILAWASFFLLGLVLVPDAIAHLTWPMLLMILAALFVVRPLAIWVSLIGSDAPPLTRLFFGWFGPRGLATALFALLVADQLGPEDGETLIHLAVNAVWISAILHGVTAAPGARAYAKRLTADKNAPEMQAMPPTMARYEQERTGRTGT